MKKSTIFRQELRSLCAIMSMVILVVVTVYLDELIFLNSMVSFVILAALKRIFRSPTGHFRLFSVSLLSGLLGAILFFLPVGLLSSFLLRGSFSALVVFLSFGRCSRRVFAKRVLLFLASSLLCAGIVFLIESVTGSDALGVVHLTPYVHLSAFVLLGVTAAFYLTVWLVLQLRPHSSARELFVIDLVRNARSVSLTALCDTGNRVYDLYTGKTVVLCQAKAVHSLFSKEEMSGIKDGCRLLPISTISGNDLLRAYCADQLIIHDGRRNYVVTAPLIAFYDTMRDGDFNAIISSDTISQCREGDYYDTAIAAVGSKKDHHLV